MTISVTAGKVTTDTEGKKMKTWKGRRKIIWYINEAHNDRPESSRKNCFLLKHLLFLKAAKCLTFKPGFHQILKIFQVLAFEIVRGRRAWRKQE